MIFALSGATVGRALRVETTGAQSKREQNKNEIDSGVLRLHSDERHVLIPLSAKIMENK